MFDNSAEENDGGPDPGAVLDVASRLVGTQASMREVIEDEFGWTMERDFVEAVRKEITSCSSCSLWVPMHDIHRCTGMSTWIRFSGLDGREWLLDPSDFKMVLKRGLVAGQVWEPNSSRIFTAEDVEFLKSCGVKL
jgi:hypothetical protein